MASNEARAAAMAMPSPGGGPDAAPAAAPAETPAAPALAVVPNPTAPATEPAAPAVEPAKPKGAVPFTDWDSLNHKTAKVKAREAKLEAREAQIAAKEAEAEQAKKEVAALREHPAIKLFEKPGDLASLARGYAAHHKITYQRALEILSHQTMNDDAPPDDVAIAAKLDPVQAKVAEQEAKLRKLEEDLAAKEQQAQKVTLSQGFVQWVSQPEMSAKYPVMSAEPASDIAEASWQIVQAYRGEHEGAWPDRDWVAGELEKAARAFYGAKAPVFERYKSATAQATGKPATDTGNPNKPEGTRDPASPGSGASTPRTLSNRSASERAATPRTNLTREERRREAMKLYPG